MSRQINVAHSLTIILLYVHAQLETDEKLVIPNAKKSIDKYGVKVWKVLLVVCALYGWHGIGIIGCFHARQFSVIVQIPLH